MSLTRTPPASTRVLERSSTSMPSLCQSTGSHEELPQTAASGPQCSAIAWCTPQAAQQLQAAGLLLDPLDIMCASCYQATALPMPQRSQGVGGGTRSLLGCKRTPKRGGAVAVECSD